MLRHFSSFNLFSATIIDINDNTLVLDNSVLFDISNAFIGEPINYKRLQYQEYN